MTGSRDGTAADGHSTAGTTITAAVSAADACAVTTVSRDGAAADGHSTAGTTITVAVSAADACAVITVSLDVAAADGYRTGVGGTVTITADACVAKS